ncbi:MAG TPA: hypothetical protein VFO83_03220, partial [Aggregicoccus sp.]|nr:hypothetical protein [Aggregicoccus sp.]
METALPSPRSFLRSLRLSPLLAGALLLVPLLAGAQEETRVAEVDATTDGRTRKETIIAYSRVDVGDTFRPGDEERAQRHLEATGLFRDVVVTTTPRGPGQVRVFIDVT